MSVVGIFGKANHPDITAVARALAMLSRQAGWEVVIESSLAEGNIEEARYLSSAEVANKADLVVVLGGDGTMIRAIRMLDERQVPVFGVNLGFLGYLTEFTIEEAKDQFALVLQGKYTTEPRVRLHADLIRDGKSLLQAKVLNDVVVNASGISRIIEIYTEIDDVYVTTYRADGLIVSTPTGSTAYSLSAGGPIVRPGTRALVVSPICPHMLTMRPLVVKDDSKITLRVEHNRESVHVTFDGQEARQLEKGDLLQISKASSNVMLIKPPKDYFQILTKKLKWGQ
jgi:NAD+ kinase